MIQKKPFIQNKPPYNPPFNRFDDRPVSKQIYKIDQTGLNMEMSSVIISANPTEILNFFTQNPFPSFIDANGNSPIHLIVLLDENKLSEQQKIDLIKQLIVPPINLSIDSTNDKSETPLHIAVKKQFGKLVKFLTLNGANSNKINFLHQNALHLAMIPNIKPCEKPTTPEALIEPESSSEDKNVLYNQILSVFYTERNKFTDVSAFINTHVDYIFSNFYPSHKRSKISLLSQTEVFEELTIEEIAMQNIQNKIYQNLSNTKMTESDIKKNISYYTVSALGKMSKTIENFVSGSLNELNLESRTGSMVGDFNLTKLLDDLMRYKPIGSTNKSTLNQDEYLESLQKTVEKSLKREMKQIHASLDKLPIPKTLKGEYEKSTNSLYGKLVPTVPTVAGAVVIKDIIDYYENLFGIGTGGANAITLVFNGPNALTFATSIQIDIIDEINKILPIHINNLNLWIAYENMKTNKFIPQPPTTPPTYWYQKALINPSSSTILEKIIVNGVAYKPLDFVLITKNPVNTDSVATKFVPAGNSTKPSNPIPEAACTLKELAIPNSFSIDNIQFDFMDYLKKAVINHVFQEIDIPAVGTIPAITGVTKTADPSKTSPFTDLWISVYNIIKSKFTNLESISEQNIHLETAMVIMQIIDRIIISNIKNKIYLESVKRLKDKILIDVEPKFSTFKGEVEKFFDKIITQTNVTLKLDKTINDMLHINKQVDDAYNIQSIIDEQSITKIFDYGSTLAIDVDGNVDYDATGTSPITANESNQIYGRYDKGDYLVFYNSDYNSVNPITIRQCMRNSTSVVKNLFSSNSPDIFKSDANGFTPIFYAIKNGNYLLVRQLINMIKNFRKGLTLNAQPTAQTFETNFYVQYQLNKYNESPIYYAFKQLKQSINEIKPDWPMINVTFMNNLLLSAQINQNIPKEYYDLYKKFVYYLDDFIKNIIQTPSSFSEFEGIIDRTTLNKPFFPTSPPTPYINSFVFKSMVTSPININIINTWSTTYFDQYEKIINNMNELIIGKKSIHHAFTQLVELKKTSNFSSQLDNLKNIVNIFEERYKSNRLYKYNNMVVNGRPLDQLDANKIKEVNRFLILLISMGIIGTRDIFKVYYKNIVLKLIFTTNVFNFDVTNPNDKVENHLKEIIGNFIDQNMFNFVKTFYLIKLDQYDRLNNNTSTIDEYLTKILELLIQNGLVMPDSETEKNIKQYINPHIGELLTKTLQYNQVLIDILHKYIVNLYHLMKTFNELTN